MLALALALALALPLALVRGAGGVELTCSSVTSVSMLVQWGVVPATDLYYVELHRDNVTDPLSHLAKPLALVTAEQTSALVEDLVPNTTYWLRVRSHPAAAPSIVWSWRADNTSLVPCTTLPTAPGAPRALRRLGNEALISAIPLAWELDADAHTPSTTAAVVVRHAFAGPRDTRLVRHTVAWEWEESEALSPGTRSHTLVNLKPGSTYLVTVCAVSAHGPRACADAVSFRTRSANTSFTEMVRVSEYTNEVDFLPNHNSADAYGQVAFLTNTNDNLFFNVTQNPPVTFYCVEHIDPSLIDGWADYISCNGPEADPYNSYDNPICICDVWPDRMIGLQTKEEMDAACGEITWVGNTHDSPACNCTDAHGNTTKWVVSEKSRRFPGRIPTYLPFFYFQVPADTYPGSQHFGWFYSTPVNGSCAPSQTIGTGDSDCSWRMQPFAKMIYAADLMRLGWNATNFDHWPLHEYGPNTTAQVQQNLPVFQAALAELDTHITQRCCGC